MMSYSGDKLSKGFQNEHRIIFTFLYRLSISWATEPVRGGTRQLGRDGDRTEPYIPALVSDHEFALDSANILYLDTT
jgi:hypothetical protein